MRLPDPSDGRRVAVYCVRPGRFDNAPHWACVKPERPPLPKVQMKSWPRNGIDFFILEKLQRNGLKPSPPADRYALVRRLALDLTGLPPTPAEVDAFVNEKQLDAYERM